MTSRSGWNTYRINQLESSNFLSVWQMEVATNKYLNIVILLIILIYFIYLIIIFYFKLNKFVNLNLR